MAPTSQFTASDPYEGQDHPQVVQAWAEMMRSSYEGHKAILKKAEIDVLSGKADPDALTRFREELGRFPENMERVKRKIENSVRVSCWHANDGESEAMWKLYGDSGKCVAVVTTVGSLARSVRAEETTEEVDIVPVKYLNFERQYPISELKDFRGRITVTKRLAYQHEQEVRLTVRPTASDPTLWEQPDFGKDKPVRLPVDIGELIQEVHISPYPSAPFETSVRIICDLFGIEKHRVKASSLLTYKQTSLAQCLTGSGHREDNPTNPAQENSPHEVA